MGQDVRSDRVQALFADAAALPAEEVTAFLNEACAGNEALREEIASLLHHRSRPLSPIIDRLDRSRVDSIDLPPPAVPGYRVGEVLGHGGCGVVYRAHQEKLGRDVALKVIRTAATAEELDRFEDEQRFQIPLVHPNIAHLYDTGLTSDRRPYFVMELVENAKPITQYCDDRQLSLKERVALMIQACDALQHAHGYGLVHRDIKPSNVLITEQDCRPLVKVIDFGVAAVFSDQQERTESNTPRGDLAGTPEYMSPEQIKAPGDQYDVRVDVFGLGVMLYQLLVGRRPFQSESPSGDRLDEAHRMLEASEAPLLREKYSQLKEETYDIAAARGLTKDALARRLGYEFDWIVQMCLAKDREQRYENAAYLRDDLERFLTKRAIAAAPPELRFYQARKLFERYPAFFISSLVAVLAVAAAFLAISSALNTAQTEKVRADSAADTAEHRAGQLARYAYAGQVAEASRSLESQPQLAARLLADQEVCPVELREFAWHYLWATLHEGQELTVRVHGGPARGLAASPDGRWFATSAADGTAYLWDAHTGAKVREFRKAADEQNVVAFSPDGNTLCLGDVTGRVELTDLRSGEISHQFDVGDCSSAAFSADGRRLAAGSADGLIYVWNLSQSDDPPMRLKNGSGWVTSVSFSPDGEQLVAVDHARAVVVWELSTGQSARTPEEYASSYFTAKWSPDGKRYAALDYDWKVRMFDARSGRLVWEQHRDDLQPHGFAFRPDGHRIALSASIGPAVVFLQTRHGTEVSRLTGQDRSGRTVAFLGTTDRVVSVDESGTARVWSTDSDQGSAMPRVRRTILLSRWEIAGADNPIAGLRYGNIVLEDPRTVSDMARGRRTGSRMHNVSASPAGDWLAASTTSGEVLVWDLSEETLRVDQDLGSDPSDLAWSEDSSALAAVVNDSVYVWGRGQPKFKKVTELAGHLLTVTFIPGTPHLLVGGRSQADTGHIPLALIIDRETGRVTGVLEGHSNGVQGVASAPNGSLVLTAGDDFTARIWNPTNGRVIHTLQHNYFVTAVAFSSDGRTVASATSKGTVHLWDPVTGYQLAVIPTEKNSIEDIDFVAGDRTLLIDCGHGHIETLGPFDGS